MQDAVLLVVDVQTIIVTEDLYNVKNVVRNIKALISACRDKGIEVIYVQHDDGPGSKLAHGTENWQIYHEVAPGKTEKIFQKQYNSSFLHTGLKEYLEGKGIKTIVLVGLLAEYCMDATCKSAFEHGFHVIVPEETNSTFDNEYLTGKALYEMFNFRIWNNRFAKVLPIAEVLGAI